MEFLISFIYIFAYFATVRAKICDPDIFGIVIGAVIIVGTVIFGPYTGGCYNLIIRLGP